MSEPRRDQNPTTPSSRPTAQIPQGRKPDQLGPKRRDAETRQEALIDEAVEETFPASNPISLKPIT